MPAKATNPRPELLPLVRAVLEQEYGQVTHLCYGCGDAGSDLLARQRQFVAGLQNRLLDGLPAGAAILLVGPSLGELASELGAQGFHCQTGDTRALAEDFQKQQFAAIVLEGTVHYLDQLSVLQGARRLLAEGGVLLLAGEYLRDDSHIAASPLANLSSARQLAERLGFELRGDEDLSAAASASLADLLTLVIQHRSAIAARFDTVADLEQSVTELQAVAAEYTSGQRCLQVFHWQFNGLPEGEYAHAEYAGIEAFEAAEIGELFKASFDQPFDAAVWHWKYALNNGRCVIARSEPGGAIVAHYGGAPRQIDYFGKPATAIQVCDVMVQPEHRRLYGKSSLFFRTAATFLEREIGNTVGHLLGFGFPNQKAMNIATRLGLYKKTDDFVELVFAPLPASGAQGQCRPFDPDDEIQGRQLQQLWQAMRRDFSSGIIGVRDRDYFHYRYRQHPRHGDYRARLLLDAQDRPLAVAVSKRHGEHELLMDLICPVAAMAPALQLLRSARSEGEVSAGLKLWVTRGWLVRLHTADAIVNDLGIEIPCNSWNPGPAAERLQGAWWLTAGDMDFM